MSIWSNDRWQPDGRGALKMDRGRPNAAARWGASLMRGSTRCPRLVRALGGLPQAAQRRMIDHQKPAIWRIPGQSASRRHGARIAHAGDVTGGNQMMAVVEGRAMRRSPAESAPISCPGAWKHLQSLPTVRIAATGKLPVDRGVSKRHRRCRRRSPSGEFRV